MNTIIRKALLVLITVTAGATAWAHHSAVAFDFSKSVNYTGVVKGFRAVEPHMKMTIELKDAKGTRVVNFEGHSVNNMKRAGYNKGMVNVGDTITVTAAPYRDGTEGGYVIGAQTASGYFGMKPRGARPTDVQAVGEEVRKAAEGR
ncbi:MAG: DUF6152 family protein [Steroidobacteraceae bacterium]